MSNGQIGTIQILWNFMGACNRKTTFLVFSWRFSLKLKGFMHYSLDLEAQFENKSVELEWFTRPVSFVRLTPNFF